MRGCRAPSSIIQSSASATDCCQRPIESLRYQCANTSSKSTSIGSDTIGPAGVRMRYGSSSFGQSST